MRGSVWVKRLCGFVCSGSRDRLETGGPIYIKASDVQMHCTLLVERPEVCALLSNQIAEESHGVLHRAADCVILVLLKNKQTSKSISEEKSLKAPH